MKCSENFLEAGTEEKHETCQPGQKMIWPKFEPDTFRIHEKRVIAVATSRVRFISVATFLGALAQLINLAPQHDHTSH